MHTYLHTYRHTYIHTYVHTLTYYYITLRYVMLRYVTLHYTTLQYSTVHYITLQTNGHTDIQTYRQTYRHAGIQTYRESLNVLWIVMWSENFDLPPAKLLAAACHNESPGVRLAPSWKESNYVHTLNCSWGEQKWLQQANHQKWWTCFLVQDEIRLGFILQWEICLPIYSHQIMGKP